MIKAVTFDYGDVIQVAKDGGNILTRTAELLNMPVEDFRAAYFKHNVLVNVEGISYYDMFRAVLRELAIEKDKEDEIIAILIERDANKVLNTELLGLFKKLRKLGLKIAILSNYSAELRNILKQQGLLDMIDTAVISGEIGFQKPNKEAFQVLFERLNVLPQETIFIDDSYKNLEKSDEIGFIPIHFKSNEQLITDLRGLGVAV